MAQRGDDPQERQDGRQGCRGPVYLRRWQVKEEVWYRNPLTGNVWPATVVRQLSAVKGAPWKYLVHVDRGADDGRAARMTIVGHSELQDRREGRRPPDGTRVEGERAATTKPRLAYYDDEDVRY